ncbi:hypothetical protein KXW65_003964 [Aspergillus fumigatus]|nr:hypothetical protein KXX58_006525 [Aspergillus fumigatus]KAH1805622.1 hypothetical protein KXX19_004797 [Aspergillus fumigatus]KAH2001640.1 hypothetical protein KXV45_004009 [Aspergillus fumigatus]KAH2061455.1 hypothetical protein KXX03_004029 [Aspergillus fumigatus]KAH2096843.1 hypothetical protein KXW65_003964 [Aspergillus fumigatus]
MEYRLSNESVPSRLYRIDYPGSRTGYSKSEDFIAAHRRKTYADQANSEFKRDIVKQFTWDCRDPVPFISLFSDREHAENWGLKQPWVGKAPYLSRSNWALYVIDTNRLEDACFFRLQDLVECLGLRLPDKADQHISGTYLCLHNIPPAAILERIEPEQVKKWDSRLAMKRVEAAEKWDYLDGYDSSEREALQENWNTIIEKNLEDSW